MSREKYRELLDKFRSIGQEHVFQFWPELVEGQRRQLLAQLEALDVQLIVELQNLLKKLSENRHYTPGTLRPFEVTTLPQNPKEQKIFEDSKKEGERLLRDGKVGALVVAGGQGTRLGFNGPKGCYPVGPVSDRTLFQYHFEKVLALEKRFKTFIPFYIMTSGFTHEETVTFLKDKNYFGKHPKDVMLFQQRMLPALDERGKILLKTKDGIALAPDGHGGMIKAIQQHDVLQDMIRREIDYIFYFQVDNPLVQICDPVFIGFHARAGAEMSAKTIYKNNPFEKLGNIGWLGEKVVIIEYTELSDQEKLQRNADGKLTFGQGSIAIHCFSRHFLERLVHSATSLPFHIAHKKIEHITKDGTLSRPLKENGYKFEQFIFDCFGIAEKVLVLETDRCYDFSPIKNKDTDGVDCPETARRDLTNLFRSWLAYCGVKREVDGRWLEISPLDALDAKELCEKLRHQNMAQIVLT